MNILVMSDSLALPRESPEICLFEETWPALLKKQGYNIHQASIGGGTSKDILRQCPYYKVFYPDFVFIQVGIVDCTPRFIKRWEKNFVDKIPGINKALLKFLNNPGIRKIRKISYVTSTQFEENIKLIKGSFGISKVVFIGIVKPSSVYEKLVPNITSQVTKYNNLLKDSASYLSLDNMTDDCIMSDHHHLNKKGHQYVFNLISQYLSMYKYA